MTPLRAVLCWLLLLVVAVVNGGLRDLYPSELSDFAAHQASTGTGAAAFTAVIWLVLRRWPLATARHAWATGALWLALTVIFELGLVVGGGGSWGEVAAQYALWRGSLWPLLLASILVAPVALSALRRRGVAVGATLGAAIAAWAACGLAFALSRAALGTAAAIWIHLATALPIGAGATLLAWRHPRHPGVLATAATIAGVPAFLDAVVVAPFMERSFAMFASPAGTWIPLTLLLVGSAAAGWRARAAGVRRSSQVGPRE